MTKKILFAILIIAMSNKSQAQFITSFGSGFEIQNSAIPVQLTAGASLYKSELVAGYTVFFHKADATIPKILFLRYGLNISKGDIEIMPLIGAGMLTKTISEVPNPLDTQHVYDYEVIQNPVQFKILYGLKVQKAIGLGGLFASVEHCKLSYLNVGLYVKIKN